MYCWLQQPQLLPYCSILQGPKRFCNLISRISIFFFRVIVISLLIFIRRERTQMSLGANLCSYWLLAMPSGAGCLTCQRSALDVVWLLTTMSRAPTVPQRCVWGHLTKPTVGLGPFSQLVMIPRLRGKVASCHHSASTPVSSQRKPLSPEWWSA